jgi:hypothetical protein
MAVTLTCDAAFTQVLRQKYNMTKVELEEGAC